MADLEEEKFRSDFEKVCKKYNWSTRHVTGSDGLQDELMFKEGLGITVELKSVKPININHSLRNKFKATQMPFYLTQIAESNTPTYIAVKYIFDKPYYGVYCLKNVKQIIDFFSLKWKDLPESHNMVSIDKIIEWIEGTLNV